MWDDGDSEELFFEEVDDEAAMELLRWVASGDTLSEAAAKVGVSRRTVEELAADGNRVLWVAVEASEGVERRRALEKRSTEVKLEVDYKNPDSISAAMAQALFEHADAMSKVIEWARGVDPSDRRQMDLLLRTLKNFLPSYQNKKSQEIPYDQEAISSEDEVVLLERMREEVLRLEDLTGRRAKAKQARIEASKGLSERECDGTG